MTGGTQGRDRQERAGNLGDSGQGKGFLVRVRKRTEGRGGKGTWNSTNGSHFWSNLSYPASTLMPSREPDL